MTIATGRKQWPGSRRFVHASHNSLGTWSASLDSHPATPSASPPRGILSNVALVIPPSTGEVPVIVAFVSPEPLRDLLTVALGIVTGVLSGAFGVGGAIISTPGVRLLGASAFLAVGTTLPSIIPGAAIATARYSREGLGVWRTVAATAPAGIAGAVVGSLGSHAVPGGGRWLMVLTAALLALTAFRMARSVVRPGLAQREPGTGSPPRGVLAAAGVGAGAGLLSGLLGVGGGLVLVPGLTEVLRLPLKSAIATSLACVGILAVPGTITHAVLGDIDWRIALLLAVAVVPGARLGAAVAIATNERRLRLIVALALGAVAVIYAGSELAAI